MLKDGKNVHQWQSISESSLLQYIAWTELLSKVLKAISMKYSEWSLKRLVYTKCKMTSVQQSELFKKWSRSTNLIPEDLTP